MSLKRILLVGEPTDPKRHLEATVWLQSKYPRALVFNPYLAIYPLQTYTNLIPTLEVLQPWVEHLTDAADYVLVLVDRETLVGRGTGVVRLACNLAEGQGKPVHLLIKQANGEWALDAELGVEGGND